MRNSSRSNQIRIDVATEVKANLISSLFSIEILFEIFSLDLLSKTNMPKATRRVVSEPDPLKFNDLYGKGIVLSNNNRQATRTSGFGDAIVFSSRTVRTYEKVFLKHRQKPVDWIGSLRVGFCMHNPRTQFTQETLPNLAFKHLTGFSFSWKYTTS
jgi:Neuralized